MQSTYHKPKQNKKKQRKRFIMDLGVWVLIELCVVIHSNNKEI